jgi:hypothetical protein
VLIRRRLYEANPLQFELHTAYALAPPNHQTFPLSSRSIDHSTDDTQGLDESSNKTTAANQTDLNNTHNESSVLSSTNIISNKEENSTNNPQTTSLRFHTNTTKHRFEQLRATKEAANKAAEDLEVITRSNIR